MHDLFLHIDEAGMGCWAGPLGVAGVVCRNDFALEGLADSKLLSKSQRERLDKTIRTSQTISFFAAEEVSAETINILGLAQAREEAIERIVANCVQDLGVQTLQGIRIDGIGRKQFHHLPTEYIVHGDSLVAGISAASVLAKVLRDTRMQQLDTEFPGYGFAQHVGYGTPEHQRALETLGPTVEHRIWYKPVQVYLERMLPEEIRV